MMWRTAALALGAAALVACADLSALTDYSASAGKVVQDRHALTRWRDSERQLRALKVEGDTCTPQRATRRPQADYDAAFAEAAVVHDTLGTYFKALGELASDKVPMPSAAVNTSLAAVKKAGVAISPQDEAAFKAVAVLLSRALDASRQRKLHDWMEASHADVDRLLGVLESLASLYRDEVAGEAGQADLFLRCSLAEGDLSDKFWGRRERGRLSAAYQAELATMDKLTAALARVRKDHQEIRKAFALDRAGLERTLKALSETRKELESAQQALDAWGRG